MEGQPTRNATQDANAGRINPPARQHEARKLGSQRVLGGDSGIRAAGEAVGRTLGSAVSQFMGKKADHINARRQLAAAERQGAEIGLNNTDAMKKRTGWQEQVFGQNVEYRAAQQKAVENGLDGQYLRLKTELDEHAAMTPAEYNEYLQTEMSTVLDQYNDKETRDIAANKWAQFGEKLATKHYENHYAYTQQQMAEQFVQHTLTIADTWELESETAYLPQEQAKIKQSQKAFFNKATKHPKQSDAAWKNGVIESLDMSLRAGNIGLYNAAKEHGFLDKLDQKSARAIEAAMGAHDTKLSHNLGRTLSLTEMSMMEATSPEEFMTAYHGAVEDISVAEDTSTRSERASAAIEQAHARLERMRERGLENLNKGMVEREKKDALVNALLVKGQGDLVYGQGATEAAGFKIAALAPPPKDLAEAGDTVIRSLVGHMTGTEDISVEDTLAAIATDVNVAKVVAKQQNAMGVTAPIVKSYFSSLTSGWSNMVTDDNQPNDSLQRMVASASQFTNNKNFRAMIGESNYEMYRLLEQGIKRKMPVGMIQNRMDKFNENKGKDIGNVWRLDTKKGETKRSKVKELLGKWGAPVTEDNISRYVDVLEQEIRISDGDWEDALEWTMRDAQNNKEVIFGKEVWGKEQLDQMTSRPFAELLNYADAQVTESGGYKFTPWEKIIHSLTNQKREARENVYRLQDVPGLEIEVVPGFDGIMLRGENSDSPVPIPASLLRKLDESLDVKRHRETERMEKLNRAKIRHLNEQMQAMPRMGGIYFPKK